MMNECTPSYKEQVSLLRKMDETPNFTQCNQASLIDVRLSLDDMDKLFDRKE